MRIFKKKKESFFFKKNYTYKAMKGNDTKSMCSVSGFHLRQANAIIHYCPAGWRLLGALLRVPLLRSICGHPMWVKPCLLAVDIGGVFEACRPSWIQTHSSRI